MVFTALSRQISRPLNRVNISAVGGDKKDLFEVVKHRSRERLDHITTPKEKMERRVGNSQDEAHQPSTRPAALRRGQWYVWYVC